MDSGQLHERIEAYLAGTLDPVRKSDFEDELAASDKLRKELELHKQADTVLRLGLRDEWKSRLKETDKGINTGRPGRVRRIRRLSVAAAILLCVAIGAHFYAHAKYDHTAIAGNELTRVEADVFRGAPDQPTTPVDQLVAAQSLFKEGKYDEATMIYLEVIQDNNLRKEDAEWNLLMCYLAADPAGQQFQLLLDKISANTQHSYQSRAETLRKTMSGTIYRLVNR